ncbi:uncharacterized protein LOC128883308 [Hylaeus volcanicus]|uniref:uncharacterized protein LOC128883308 n=1 Tax=Hylaeus volcanicus TaxID=313075 RepID=UPI0023B86F95|nr:uncharacterized protein LOC128883308 [Hylaeus volcanicus]XP_053991495.1 uncharacterized protein LOC128883308 [Hylaeus volcanicus]
MIHFVYFITFFFLSVPYNLRFVLNSNLSECDFAVSISAGTPNKKCRQLCNDNSSDFEKFCVYVEYDRESGQLSSENDKCFSSYVPGYSDEAFSTKKPHEMDKLFTDLKDYEKNRSKLQMLAFVGLYKLGPKSFIECQEMCQNDPLCEYFVFRLVPDEYESPDAQYAQRRGCLLKTKRSVKEAYDIQFIVEDGVVVTEGYSWEFCNLNMGFQCRFRGYDCQICDDIQRCVWKSSFFISGPKYCPETFEFCPNPKLPFVPSVPTPDPSTPTPPTSGFPPSPDPSSSTSSPDPSSSTSSPDPSSSTSSPDPSSSTSSPDPSSSTSSPDPSSSTSSPDPSISSATPPDNPSSTFPPIEASSTIPPSNDWTTAKENDSNEMEVNTDDHEKQEDFNETIPVKPQPTQSKKGSPIIAPAVAGVVGVAAALGLVGMRMMSSPTIQEPEMFFSNNENEYFNDETRNLVANVDNSMFT